ncbi:MAG: GntR family transcriptional regulator [Chloroflexi bacterium]|nr:GntR family transcriptional regulator [Chloroflexota bacterium]
MPPLRATLSQNPPLRDQAYSALKDAILSGRFAPGDHLVELEIAQSLGLSRSPVREAFRRLEQEGYLCVTRTGVVVQQISLKDIESVYYVRQRLEGMASALAAICATDEDIAQLRQSIKVMEVALKEKNQKKVVRAGNDFHALLYSVSDNKYLIDLLNVTYEKIRHFRTVNITVHDRGREAVEEHRAVVEAIARHDAVKADRYSQEHVQNSWAHTKRALEKSANEKN